MQAVGYVRSVVGLSGYVELVHKLELMTTGLIICEFITSQGEIRNGAESDGGQVGPGR